MNTDNNSKWKKSFSDTDTTAFDADNEFQTKHMMHKINSVKKKRKLKNYKNIPILQNIHDELPDEDISKVPILKTNITEGFNILPPPPPKPTPKPPRDMNDFSDLDDPNVKVVDKGITYYGIPDGPEYWEGLDEGDTGQNATDPRQILINALNSARAAIQKFNHDQAKMIAGALSKDPKTKSPTHTDADVILLQKYISYFESIICAYFFAYNIIYVSMYIDENGERIKIPRITSTFFKNYSTKSGSETLGMSLVAKGVVYFLTYALYFSDIMQTMVLDVFPEYFLRFLNAPSYMIAIFISLVFVIENFTPFLIQFFTDVIMMNTTNNTVNLMYFFVIFMFIIECFGTFDVRTFTYSANNLVWIISNPLTSLILGIIQFIIAIMISVPVGAVLCTTLFVFYSFSIFLYPLSILKLEKLLDSFGMFDNIDGYLKRSFQLNFDPNDKDLDMVQRTQIIITIIFDFLNSYIYYIANVVMLSFSTADYAKNTQSKHLKVNLLLVNGALLFMFVALCINGFFSKLKIDRKASEDDVKIKNKEKAYYEAQHKARQEKSNQNLGVPGVPPEILASQMAKKLPIPSGIERFTNMIPGLTKFNKMEAALPSAVPQTVVNATGNIPPLPTTNMLNNPLDALASAVSPPVLPTDVGTINPLAEMPPISLPAPQITSEPSLQNIANNALAAASSIPSKPDL